MTSDSNQLQVAVTLIKRCGEHLLTRGRVSEAFFLFRYSASILSTSANSPSQQEAFLLASAQTLAPFIWQPAPASVTQCQDLLSNVHTLPTPQQIRAFLGIARAELSLGNLSNAGNLLLKCLDAARCNDELALPAMLGLAYLERLTRESHTSKKSVEEFFTRLVSNKTNYDFQRVVAASAIVLASPSSETLSQHRDAASRFLRHCGQSGCGSTAIFSALSQLRNQPYRASTTQAERNLWKRLTALPNLDHVAVMAACSLASRWMNRGIRQPFLAVIGYLSMDCTR